MKERHRHRTGDRTNGALHLPMRAKSKRASDSIPTDALMVLADRSGAFDWLNDPAEDIYSASDGEPATWPKKRKRSTNGVV